jgi:glycine/D-amino acid oxidase-like deaminating enzyme
MIDVSIKHIDRYVCLQVVMMVSARDRAVVPATPQRSAWLRTAVPATSSPRLGADQRTDILIVGAGYAGLNAAIRLRELGRDCIVLEAEEPGFGASGRNGGQVVPGLKHDPAELVAIMGEERGLALARFAGDAASRTFDLIRHQQIQCDAEACGWLQPAVDSKTLQTAIRRAKSWADFAGVAVRTLDKPAIRKMTGTDAYVGGWIDPRGGQLQPLSYARELARVASSMGAQIFSGSAATALSRSGREWIVEANGCQTRADAVLICTNGYTGRLVPRLDRTLIPASSIMCATAPLSPALRSQIMPAVLPISDARRLLTYMRFDKEGRFMIGARGSFGLHEPERYFRWLREAAVKTFPALQDAAWQDAWGGRFALTLNHLPHIHNPERGLLATLGCNGRGVAMMSQMGRLAADLAANELPTSRSPLPITPMQPLGWHALRRPALELATLYYRVVDSVSL